MKILKIMKYLFFFSVSSFRSVEITWYNYAVIKSLQQGCLEVKLVVPPRIKLHIVDNKVKRANLKTGVTSKQSTPNFPKKRTFLTS